MIQGEVYEEVESYHCRIPGESHEEKEACAEMESYTVKESYIEQQPYTVQEAYLEN